MDKVDRTPEAGGGKILKERGEDFKSSRNTPYFIRRNEKRTEESWDLDSDKTELNDGRLILFSLRIFQS